MFWKYLAPSESAPRHDPAVPFGGHGASGLAPPGNSHAGPGLWLLPAGLLLVAAIGGVAYCSGPTLSFTLFYLLPVGWAAWRGGLAYGVLLSLAAVLTWHVADVLADAEAHPALLVLNGVVRFGTFVIASSLLSRLRSSLLLEQALARTDPLTGAANGRTFYEVVCATLERSRRSSKPLTLAYLDLDGFKQLNDCFGHAAGDEALRHVARTLGHSLRAVDLLARLGGDEFALLLPDTDGPGARTLLTRLHHLLTDEAAARGWPIGVSLGAATFVRPPRDVDVLVRRSDALMYKAKRNGKGRVEHEVIVDAKPLGTVDRSGIERRAVARLLCDRLARVRVGEGQDEEEATGVAKVRDLSLSGMRFQLDRRLPLESLLTVEPLYPCGARTLLARVVWTSEDGGDWQHGCALCSPLSEEELRCWTEEQSEEAASPPASDPNLQPALDAEPRSAVVATP
jgi:diguanylate cyclase (GGDEF)-like protein